MRRTMTLGARNPTFGGPTVWNIQGLPVGAGVDAYTLAGLLLRMTLTVTTGENGALEAGHAYQIIRQLLVEVAGIPVYNLNGWEILRFNQVRHGLLCGMPIHGALGAQATADVSLVVPIWFEDPQGQRAEDSGILCALAENGTVTLNLAGAGDIGVVCTASNPVAEVYPILRRTSDVALTAIPVVESRTLDEVDYTPPGIYTDFIIKRYEGFAAEPGPLSVYAGDEQIHRNVDPAFLLDWWRNDHIGDTMIPFLVACEQNVGGVPTTFDQEPIDLDPELWECVPLIWPERGPTGLTRLVDTQGQRLRLEIPRNAADVTSIVAIYRYYRALGTADAADQARRIRVDLKRVAGKRQANSKKAVSREAVSTGIGIKAIPFKLTGGAPDALGSYSRQVLKK